MSKGVRYGTAGVLGAAGIHEFGLGGALAGLGETAIENALSRSQMATRQKLDQAITKLLMNRNGEGVAALGGNP